MNQEYKYMVCTKCFTYNHSHFIKDALDGFVRQETDFPVVSCIIDDASNDGEQDIINKYFIDNFDVNDKEVYLEEDNNDYFMMFARHKENENCYFAVYLLKYNHYSVSGKFSLIEEYISNWVKSAKYIAICEGDDYWIDSCKLHKQVKVLEEKPDYVMCHSSFQYYYEFDKKFYSSKSVYVNQTILNKGLSPENILTNYHIRTCTVLIRLNAYLEAKLSDPFLFSGYFILGDIPLWYSLSKIGDIYFLPEVTCVYRKNKGSLTMSTNIQKWLRFIVASTEMRLYLAKRDNLSVAFTRRIQNKYNKILMCYVEFDKNFKPLFPFKKPSTGLFVLLKRCHLLKITLMIFFSNRKWIGFFRRIGKRSLY